MAGPTLTAKQQWAALEDDIQHERRKLDLFRQLPGRAAREQADQIERRIVQLRAVRERWHRGR